MEDRSLKGIQGAVELAPANPNLLSSGVHHNVVVVSGAVQACNIAEHGLRCDLSMLRGNNICQAGIMRGLHVLVKEENAVKLRMRDWVVVSKVFVIVKIKEVSSVVHSAERVIREGAPSTVNLHCSMRTSQIVVNVHDIIGELYCVTEYEHPWLAEVGHLRRLRVDAGIVNKHNFLAC